MREVGRLRVLQMGDDGEFQIVQELTVEPGQWISVECLDAAVDVYPDAMEVCVTEVDGSVITVYP